MFIPMTFATTFQGDCKFSGATGSSKACSLLYSEERLTVAMNSKQFEHGLSCGRCVRIRGNGQGTGMTPIMGTFYATVDNECPHCKFGDMELEAEGHGRWKISWNWMNCSHFGNIYR